MTTPFPELDARDDLPRIGTLSRHRKWQVLADRLGVSYSRAREIGRWVRERADWPQDDGSRRPRRASPAPEADRPEPEGVEQGAEPEDTDEERAVPEWDPAHRDPEVDDLKHVDRGPSGSYVYSRSTRTYLFFLPGAAGAIRMSADRVDQFCADYSNMIDKGHTINEIARAQDLLRPEVIGIKRLLGITHDSPPWTDEALDEKSDEEILGDVRRRRRRAIYQKAEREKWREIQRDADRFRRFQAAVIEPLRAEFVAGAPAYEPPPPIKMREARRPYRLVVGLTDEHWGKRGVDGYDREVQRARYRDLVERLVAEASLLGRPERIIVPLGSDGLHVDTATGTTTAGTPQDVDGHPLELARSWVDYKREHVDMLSQVAPVDLWPLAGNHDRMTTMVLVEALRGWFHHRPDVRVVGDSLRTIQAEQYGDVLIAMHHGDGLKVRDLSEIVPRRFAGEWGRTRWRYCWTGHYHTERELPQKSDLQVIRWPAACGTDRWHYEQGYDGGRKALRADVVCPRDGVVHTINLPARDEQAA